jgi:hypothetical protein
VWWLTFRHGDVVIVEAASLVHARTVAALNGLGRPAHFAEGHFIEPECMQQFPDSAISRMLSRTEAQQLRKLLEFSSA